MDIEFVRSRFIKHFDGKTGNIYTSPGRINLIGEHTDYNGGFVFPGAVDKGIMAEVRPNGLKTVIAYSIDLKDKVEFKVDDPEGPRATWARYIYGIVQEMRKLGVDVKGFNTAFAGDVPQGAGMSSSAALESCFAFALNDLFGDNKVSKWDLVLAGQATEHKYVGVNCGIMDQFAVGMGKKDCAMLLDCNTLKYRYSKIALEGASIVITNTNKPHSLASSAYNVRRAQCEHALNELKEVKPELNALGELSNEDFNKIAGHISEPLERQRARHAVLENNRTLEAVDALEKNDVEKFGRLMNASHFSLRDDYDVTGKELDTLAEIAWTIPGVIGSRMTGAGFGGSTVSLVKNDAIENFKKTVSEGYTKKIGYAPSFYVANISEGTHRIEE